MVYLPMWEIYYFIPCRPAFQITWGKFVSLLSHNMLAFPAHATLCELTM
jgi:hypothetical protein